MRLIMDFVPWVEHPGVPRGCAMILQASSQSKAECMCTGGIPIFTSIARLAGFVLAVRQTVPPVRSRAPPVAIETGQIGNFYESRHDRAYPATRPYSKHPTRAASCAIILANSGHASLSVSIV